VAHWEDGGCHWLSLRQLHSQGLERGKQCVCVCVCVVQGDAK
jgi:hypothetical protein